jgi:hypothetical protein
MISHNCRINYTAWNRIAGAVSGTTTNLPQISGGNSEAPIDNGTMLRNSAAVDKLPGLAKKGKFYTYVGRNFNSSDIATDSNINIRSS